MADQFHDLSSGELSLAGVPREKLEHLLRVCCDLDGYHVPPDPRFAIIDIARYEQIVECAKACLNHVEVTVRSPDVAPLPDATTEQKPLAASPQNRITKRIRKPPQPVAGHQQHAVLVMIRDMRCVDATWTDIASALNEAGHVTLRGKPWQPQNTKRFWTQEGMDV